MTQVFSCPITLSPLEIIDERLKEFVRLHHIDLVRTINYQVTKLKDNISEKQLFEQLSYYYLTMEQVLITSQILNIVYFSILLISFLVRNNQSFNTYL